MLRLRHQLFIRVCRLIDQVVLFLIAGSVFYFRPDFSVSGVNSEFVKEASFRLEDSLGIVLLVFGWFIIYSRCVRYTGDRFTYLWTQLKNVFYAATISAFWLLLIATIFDFRSFPSMNVTIFWVLAVVAGSITRLSVRHFLMRARKSGLNYRYLLIIGANDRSREIVEKIQSRRVLGYKVAGYVTEKEEDARDHSESTEGPSPILGHLADLQRILETERVDEVMICLSVESKFSDVTTVVKRAKDLGIVVRILPSMQETDFLKGLHVESFEGTHFITLFREQLLVHLLVKRTMDLTFSVFGLLFLAPMLALVAILIKMNDGGPIFFAQDRVGMNKRRFKMLKFRTMVTNAEDLKAALVEKNEQSGPAFKIKHDPRVTRIGRFLRKFSIDELPQLWNVLQGEMSLVGPRPPLPSEIEQYEWLYRKRLSVKPGITCLWQVSGRDNIGFAEWMELDSRYIDNWSVWMDLKILARTIPAVVFSKGSS